MMWIFRSDEPAVTFRIRPGSTKTIGRATQAELMLDAPLVSRIHCRVDAGDDSVTLVDLKSTNGTFVNDVRIEQVRVREGDRLRVGRVEFVVERAGSDLG